MAPFIQSRLDDVKLDLSPPDPNTSHTPPSSTAFVTWQVLAVVSLVLLTIAIVYILGFACCDPVHKRKAVQELTRLRSIQNAQAANLMTVQTEKARLEAKVKSLESELERMR